MKKTHIALGLLLTALATSAVAQAVPQESRAFEVDATLVPNIPATGENTLEFTLQEGDKPVAGLKLTSAVGMTNMDMGVAHPTVAEPDPGHYVVKPDLQMKGPWRVTIRCKDPKFKLDFDLEAGSKEPWQFKKRTFRVPQMEEPMEGMSHPATSSIPTLKEKETYEVKGGEDWDIRTGFGKNLGMVQMMLLMMVTGSGMEGMKMPPMNIVFNDASFQESDATQTGSLKIDLKLDAKPTIGQNAATFTVKTPEGDSIEGAEIEASVAMTNMDMGTAHPKVKDLGKGKYALEAKFGMKGPWRITLVVTPKGMKPETYHFDFEAK